MRPQRIFLSVVLLLLITAAALGQQITPVTQGGQKLTSLLDSMDVEHLWIAREHVDWRTGKPTGKPVTDDRTHTHCSAFVAAFSAKLGIYILRPPEHTATNLANPQHDWLQKEGKERGWKPVKTMLEAQNQANQGELVVAVYKASDPTHSGHIAVVRPAEKSADAIQKEGPQITQAGMENFSSTSLKEGFRHHKDAWKDHAILFFSHKIDWDSVKATPDKKVGH